MIPESGRSTGEGIGYPLQYFWASLVAHLVKNLPAMWETWVQSLGWEDPLEKRKSTHSSILAGRIPWTAVHRFAKSWTRLSDFHFHFLGEKNKEWDVEIGEYWMGSFMGCWGHLGEAVNVFTTQHSGTMLNPDLVR